MITLISGTPGAGKTAYVVNELRRMVEEIDQTPGAELRPIFVMGIPELQLPHIPVPPIADWTKIVPVEEDPTLKEAVFTFPDGALVIIDEAQKVYRQRPVGSKVPDHVAAFEKHRHLGLDFWLITQRPHQVDSHVRGLVGKHIHLRSFWAGRRLYEWDESADPRSKSELADAAIRPYKLPASAFSLYKSASLHIKPERRKPVQLYAFAALVVLAGFLGWYATGRISARVAPDDSTATATPATPAAPAPAPASQFVSAPALAPADIPALAPTVASVPVGTAPDDWKPRLTHRPETAPVYDAIRQARVLPVVKGCIEMRDACRCFTQQGTDAFLSPEECRAWLKSPSFNPWGEPEGNGQPRPEATPPSGGGTGAATV